ncbi:hypothetical protein [Brevundimonas sp. NIBR11]|uniref:hypothetical protein n=1 Tax=Brevundimonas sp. NIBR11 TaxID=3015999 RepID=UPI0022F07DFB|nr:hypothetical protein [Brevundimonas sp. NIBR11]
MSDRLDDSPVTWGDLRSAVRDLAEFAMVAASELTIIANKISKGEEVDPDQVPDHLLKLAQALEDKYELDEAGQ